MEYKTGIHSYAELFFMLRIFFLSLSAVLTGPFTIIIPFIKQRKTRPTDKDHRIWELNSCRTRHVTNTGRIWDFCLRENLFYFGTSKLGESKRDPKRNTCFSLFPLPQETTLLSNRRNPFCVELAHRNLLQSLRLPGRSTDFCRPTGFMAPGC